MHVQSLGIQLQSREHGGRSKGGLRLYRDNAKENKYSRITRYILHIGVRVGNMEIL